MTGTLPEVAASSPRPASDPLDRPEPAPAPPGVPFFIVGCQRSGTSLLRLMLNRHPLLHVPRESWFLIDLMNHLPHREPLAPDQVSVAHRLITRHRRWQDWGIGEQELSAALASLHHPRLSDVVDAAFRLSCTRWGKPRWGDKTPGYQGEIDRLQAVFPEARFIQVIRDGRDAVSSLLRSGFHPGPIEETARLWAAEVSSGISAGERLPAECYRRVSYEQLVLSTSSTLSDLCSFLEVDYDPRMLTFFDEAARHLGPLNETIHRKTLRPPAPDDAHRWRREMSRSDVLRIEAVAGGTMGRAGQRRAFRGPARLLPSTLALLERLGRRMGTFRSWSIVRAARRFRSRVRMTLGLEPLSVFWGEDRGLPLVRYYAERFLEQHASSVRGRCLEFQEDKYTTRLGGAAVSSIDILHVDSSNPRATIVADLTQPNDVPSGRFDCVVCTFVLHVIQDVERCVRELHRILAPGGTLLVVVPHISMCDARYGEIWRFTPEGLGRILGAVFGDDGVDLRAYGNSLTCAGQLRGLVTEELTPAELDHHDARFALIVCAAAQKGTPEVE